MSPLAAAMRTGLARGWTELRHTFTTTTDILGYLLPTLILLVVMLFMRDSTVGTTGFSLGAATLPGTLGVSVAFGGLLTLAQVLSVEREDGTLLRAKAVPNGMTGYLVGKILQTAGMSVVSLALLLVPGLLLFDGLALDTAGAWFTLTWVLLLGLVACLPIGAVIGSVFENPRLAGLLNLPVMGLVAISGVFFPITEVAPWLQVVAQAFPIYWLGLGMRSALLPDELVVVEIGGSWRHLETVGVLGVWAVLGLLVAPVVLRRMARRESGSSVAARREKALQRIG